MTDEMLARIKNYPLRFPYADYSALRQINSVDARFAAGSDQLTEEEAEAFGLDVNRLPELVLARWKASEYVTMVMKKRRITQLEATAASGIDPTLFSKYASMVRPFTPLPQNLTPFCYKVMEESCHKVMFGEPGEIVISSFYATIAKNLLLTSEKVKKALLAEGYRILRENPGEPEQIDIIQERISEYCYEKGRRFSQFFGERPQRQLENRFYFIFDQEDPRVPKIPLLMFLASESGQALDYFISPDCIKWVPTFYYDGEKKVALEDEVTRSIINLCYSMSKENRAKYIPIVLQEVYSCILS